MEQRGWIVGMTSLKLQPSIVWDRMLVADLTLITSKEKSLDRWLLGNLAFVHPVDFRLMLEMFRHIYQIHLLSVITMQQY